MKKYIGTLRWVHKPDAYADSEVVQAEDLEEATNMLKVSLAAESNKLGHDLIGMLELGIAILDVREITDEAIAEEGREMAKEKAELYLVPKCDPSDISEEDRREIMDQMVKKGYLTQEQADEGFANMKPAQNGKGFITTITGMTQGHWAKVAFKETEKHKAHWN